MAGGVKPKVLTDTELAEIEELIKQGMCRQKVARMYHVGKDRIYRIFGKKGEKNELKAYEMYQTPKLIEFEIKARRNLKQAKIDWDSYSTGQKVVGYYRFNEGKDKTKVDGVIIYKNSKFVTIKNKNSNVTISFAELISNTANIKLKLDA